MSEQIATQPPGFRELLDLLGASDGEIASAIGVKPTAVRQMRRRGSVHARHWPAFVEALRRKGRRDVSLEVLARCAVAAAPLLDRLRGEDDKITHARRSLAAHKGWKRRRDMRTAAENEDGGEQALAEEAAA